MPILPHTDASVPGLQAHRLRLAGEVKPVVDITGAERDEMFAHMGRELLRV